MTKVKLGKLVKVCSARNCSALGEPQEITEFRLIRYSGKHTKLCQNCRDRGRVAQDGWRDRHPEEALERTAVCAKRRQRENPEYARRTMDLYHESRTPEQMEAIRQKANAHSRKQYRKEKEARDELR